MFQFLINEFLFIFQVYIDDCICNFKSDVESWKSKYHETSLIHLTYEFFQFYSDLDFNEFVISPLEGLLIPKLDIKKRRPSFIQKYLKNFYQKNITLQIDTALCVQDPFDIMHNIARGYSKPALNTFRQKCKTAAKICEGIKSGTKTLSSLFEYYEISSRIEDISFELPSGENKDAECDIVSIASEDSVELLQELESLERAGGVGALMRENTKLSEDSGCEVNGSLESVNSGSVVEESTKEIVSKQVVASEDDDITFIGKITVGHNSETVEVVNLENSPKKTTTEASPKTSSKNTSNGKLEDPTEIKNGSCPLIIDVDSVESNKNSFDLSEEDSIFVIEEIKSPGECLNPSKEPFNFTINYSSNCSYDILDDGSLRPRKRGHVNSSSKEKFVSDLVLFILKEAMKCNVLKVDTYINGNEEYNLKDFRKRTIVEDSCPQKFLKINAEEGKAVKSKFTLLSSFVCEPLYRVWVNRKKIHKEMKIPLVNPLQIEMFISNKVAERESAILSKKGIVVKLWKDATKSNIFWVSLRQENNEEIGKSIVSLFNDLFHKITTNIFSQIDDFLKWS